MDGKKQYEFNLYLLWKKLEISTTDNNTFWDGHVIYLFNFKHQWYYVKEASF